MRSKGVGHEESTPCEGVSHKRGTSGEGGPWASATGTGGVSVKRRRPQTRFTRSEDIQGRRPRGSECKSIGASATNTSRQVGRIPKGVGHKGSRNGVGGKRTGSLILGRCVRKRSWSSH
ncbi:uncharacterized protein LOC143220002 [Lasioglossum baleicum]|uniref:uncharacterized protein LOC143220002 n=1 Tax=Lasioglossum baleicum TaxID=434251 RepID=UPI003FCC4F80